MLNTVIFRTLSTAALLTLVAAPPASAQSNDVSACYNRCSSEFSVCFGLPDPDEDPEIITESGGDGTVPTQIPYESCLAQKHACDATCNADYVTSRVKPSE